MEPMLLLGKALVFGVLFYLFAWLPFRILTRRFGFEPAGVLVVLSFILTAAVMILTH